MPKTKPTAKRLEPYARKRNFSRTPEPPATLPAARNNQAKRAAPLTFCVQKHLARALHYDFRLEHRGVLLSWAVPKGPSLNPHDRRMAVRTEDHPLDYGGFEGVIPDGYGQGIVILWDRGTWALDGDGDVDAALTKGELKFSVDGVKLKGSWVLVRTKRQTDADREQWLLIKHRDDWSGEDVDVTAAAPDSVKSFTGFAGVLNASKDRAAFLAHKPAGGGQAASLLRAVIAEAAEADRHKPAPTRKAPAAPAEKKRAAAVPGAVPAAAPPSAGAGQPKLSNQQKVLFPASGLTKGQLIDYYVRVAPLILPHLAGRAVTLKRYPDGVEGKSFFEKRCPSHRPDWVKTVAVASTTEAIDYCLIEDVASLTWAANLAAIELHVPLALGASPDQPTAVVFDLDPGPPATIVDAARVAMRLRGLFDTLGLKSFVKRSGGKGLHILAPLNDPSATFDQTKSFARAIALTLERDDPKGVISSMSRSARAGKVFVDWGQNDRGKTTVCAYSVRARELPSISFPLTWDEVEAGDIEPVVANAVRLPRKDPLAPVLTLRQAIPSFK